MTGSPERTDDGRYVVVNGRKWRASDPDIPPRLRQELVDELMAARRAVGSGKRVADEPSQAAARRRVADAKHALGERGHPWWKPLDLDAVAARATATTRSLLRHRAADSSICPSDVARVVHSPSWRALLPNVRDAIVDLLADGEVSVTRAGEEVDSFDGGPVRIRRGPRFPDVP